MPTRDFRNLPDEALLALDELVPPAGPLPFKRSRFLEAVRLGEAPKPAFKAPRCTRWRWADVRAWLDALAADGRKGA